MSKIEKYVCDGCHKELCKVGHHDYIEFRVPAAGAIQLCSHCAGVLEQAFGALGASITPQPHETVPGPSIYVVWFGGGL